MNTHLYSLLATTTVELLNSVPVSLSTHLIVPVGQPVEPASFASSSVLFAAVILV